MRRDDGFDWRLAEEGGRVSSSSSSVLVWVFVSLAFFNGALFAKSDEFGEHERLLLGRRSSSLLSSRLNSILSDSQFNFNSLFGLSSPFGPLLKLNKDSLLSELGDKNPLFVIKSDLWCVVPFNSEPFNDEVDGFEFKLFALPVSLCTSVREVLNVSKINIFI